MDNWGQAVHSGIWSTSEAAQAPKGDNPPLSRALPHTAIDAQSPRCYNRICNRTKENERKDKLMRRRLYRQERHDLILQRLRDTGYVSVAELADGLDVSSVTVRADLDALESAGQLLRTHGGAVPIHVGEGALGDTQLSFSVRQRTRVEAKERIGAAAAALVADGEAIILDASTTIWHMAHHLLPRRDLTVLTTGLYVALELLRSPGISVIMPGGAIWREAAAIVGPREGDMLAQGNFQRVFIGGRGLTLAEGLTDPNPDEVALKRQFVGAAREVNVLLDASKLGRVSFASCIGLEQIDRIITDREAQPPLVAALRERGIEVLLA